MYATRCPYCRRRFVDPDESRAHRLTHLLADAAWFDRHERGQGDEGTE
jgi:hypothetical protein